MLIVSLQESGHQLFHAALLSVLFALVTGVNVVAVFRSLKQVDCFDWIECGIIDANYTVHVPALYVAVIRDCVLGSIF